MRHAINWKADDAETTFASLRSDLGRNGRLADLRCDGSPVYYPDGRIVFSSSRVESYSLCQNYLACALYAIDAGGSDLRRIDYTTLCYLRLPGILREAREALENTPRIDMPEATPIAQERDFGRTF